LAGYGDYSQEASVEYTLTRLVAVLSELVVVESLLCMSSVAPASSIALFLYSTPPFFLLSREARLSVHAKKNRKSFRLLVSSHIARWLLICQFPIYISPAAMLKAVIHLFSVVVPHAQNLHHPDEDVEEVQLQTD